MTPEVPKWPITALPSKTSPCLRLNTIAPYYTMFPLKFAFEAMSGAKSDSWVLDPFCGRGTTLFAARLRRLHSVGIDSSQVAAAIAAAKLVDVSPEALFQECRRILDEAPAPKIVPSGEFWSMCYHSQTLIDMCRVREALLDLQPTQERIALRALMLGILHGPLGKRRPSYLSNQMPRTYSTKPGPAVRFWRRSGLFEPPRVDLLELVERRAHFVFQDVPPGVCGRVIQGDSREASVFPTSIKFDHVVTSPPYLGMNTYVPDQWLRQWFLGGKDDVDYSCGGQIGSSSLYSFQEGLVNVWRNIAKVCNPGCTMVVRFGTLPSVKANPEEVLRETLCFSDSNWIYKESRSAGSAKNGRRQALQFVQEIGSPQEEIDLYAELGG